MDTGFIDYCLNIGAFTQESISDLFPQIREGSSLYEVIIRSNLLSQERLAVIAGEYYHAPVVDLSRIKPETKAIVYGSVCDCKRFGFLPFGLDPLVGLLVAVADYSSIEQIQRFLKNLRVSSVKFYIAPYDTLYKMIELVYENSDPGLSFASKLKRSASILRTQSAELDTANIKKPIVQNSIQGIDVRRLQALSLELAECREENKGLKQRIEQLSATVELESEMIRELAKILKQTGILDERSFEQWLLAQR